MGPFVLSELDVSVVFQTSLYDLNHPEVSKQEQKSPRVSSGAAAGGVF